MMIGGFTLLFMLYLVNPGIERILYLNELFSLVGLGIFLRYRYYCENIYAIRIRRSVYAFIAIGLAYLVISYYFFDINWYGYLRGSQIVYSVFSFFLGLKIYDYLGADHPNKAVILAFCLFAVFWGTWGYSAAVLLPGLLMKNSSSHKYLLIVLFLYVLVNMEGLIVGADQGGMTPVIFLILLLLLSFFFLHGKAYFGAKLAMYSIVLAAFWILYLVFPIIDTLLVDGFAPFNTQIARLFSISDTNISWRIGLWVTLIKEKFLNEIWGIGFGVSLFPEGLETKINLRAYEDPNFKFTLGAHNSFLTLLVRLGVVGFGIICMMNLGLLLSIRSNVQKWFFNNDVFRFSIFLCLIAITFQALFHVVIETPLYSSVYWVSWGLFYKALATDI